MKLFCVAGFLLLIPWVTAASAQTIGPPKWEAVSENHQITASLYPREGIVKVGVFQKWVLQLKDPEGKAIYPARISLGGGMPAHGHGLPTQPQVSDYLDQGKYLIEGMKFNMSGDWVLVFGVNSEQATDTLRFELSVGY